MESIVKICYKKYSHYLCELIFVGLFFTTFFLQPNKKPEWYVFVNVSERYSLSYHWKQVEPVGFGEREKSLYIQKSRILESYTVVFIANILNIVFRMKFFLCQLYSRICCKSLQEIWPCYIITLQLSCFVKGVKQMFIVVGHFIEILFRYRISKMIWLDIFQEL